MASLEIQGIGWSQFISVCGFFNVAPYVILQRALKEQTRKGHPKGTLYTAQGMLTRTSNIQFDNESLNNLCLLFSTWLTLPVA